MRDKGPDKILPSTGVMTQMNHILTNAFGGCMLKIIVVIFHGKKKAFSVTFEQTVVEFRLKLPPKSFN